MANVASLIDPPTIEGAEVVAMLSAQLGVPIIAQTSPDGVVGPCALWGNAPDKHGYGRARSMSKGRSTLAHRVTYESTVGQIPDGLELDHVCRVRLCVNPRHLDPVSHAENMRRARGLRQDNRTMCVNGHAFTPENTRLIKRVRKNRDSAYYERRCRTCLRDAQLRQTTRAASRRAES